MALLGTSVALLALLACGLSRSGPALDLVPFTILVLPLAGRYSSKLVKLFPWHVRSGHLPAVRAEDALRQNDLVFIAVPVVLTSSDQIGAVSDRLRRLGDSIRSSSFRFALLSDFIDSAEPTTPNDDAILAALAVSIEALNAKYRDAKGDRFVALHRRRRWSDTQRLWIGWERKRGKMLEFTQLLLRRDMPTSFSWSFGDLEALVEEYNIPYLICLDETSWLDERSARELIRTAAHPANRPVWDPSGREIVGGYTILQSTRIEVSSIAPALEAHDSTSAMLPPASGVAASFYFRTFDVGVHKGTGALYNVDAYWRALHDAFPENVVLHHDVLEGFAARTGEVPTATVLCTLAPDYPAQARRGHRWMRGALQALPWVLPRIPDATGRMRPNPFGAIERFVLVEWVTVELSKPASFLLMLLAWAGLTAYPGLSTLVACPVLIEETLRLTASRLLLSRRELRANSLRLQVGGVVFDAALEAMLLVHNSMIVLDALARTIWRSATGRHLLQWKTRDTPAPWTPPRAAAYAVAMWPSVLTGAVVLVAGYYLRSVPWYAAGFALGWIAAPFVLALADAVRGPSMAAT